MTDPAVAGRKPWHAGQHEPGYPQLTVELSELNSSGPVVLLADVSEFQPNIADAAYLAWSKAIVIRAAYGDAHDDKAWFGGARRADLHKGGVRFLGIYQYIVQGQDPVAQAQALHSIVGDLKPGEKIIGDLEEGAGNQRPRWDAWDAEVKKLFGHGAWDYSGLNFSISHGIAPVSWVAAYQTAEPTEGHTLWQFTDNFSVPGVGTADCSVFHGTIGELAALAYQPAEQPSGVHGSARYTNATLWWEAGARTEEFEVYLAHPDGTTIEKFPVPADKDNYEFHRIHPMTSYKLGVLAKPAAPGVKAQYVTVRTR